MIWIGRFGGTKYKVCKDMKLELETYDPFVPTSVAGDYTQIIFPDDITSDLISNVSGVFTILRKANIDMNTSFNFSKTLGGEDEVRVVLINSDIFDVTKIIRQVIFNTSTNPFKTTARLVDTLVCSEEESIGRKYTLWIVRENGTTSGLEALPIGHTRTSPSAHIIFTEVVLKEI